MPNHSPKQNEGTCFLTIQTQEVPLLPNKARDFRKSETAQKAGHLYPVSTEMVLAAPLSIFPPSCHFSFPGFILKTFKPTEKVEE